MTNFTLVDGDCKAEPLPTFEDALMTLDESIEQFDCEGFLDLLETDEAIEPIPDASVETEIHASQSVEQVNISTEQHKGSESQNAPSHKRNRRPSIRAPSPPRKRPSVKDTRGIDISPETFSDSCPELQDSDPAAFGAPREKSDSPSVSSSTPPAEEPNKNIASERSSSNAVDQAEFDRMMNKLALSMQRSELSRRNLTGNLTTVRQEHQRRSTNAATESERRVAAPPAAKSAALPRAPQFQTLTGLSGFLNGTRPTLTAALEQSRKQLWAYGGMSFTKTL